MITDGRTERSTFCATCPRCGNYVGRTARFDWFTCSCGATVTVRWNDTVLSHDARVRLSHATAITLLYVETDTVRTLHDWIMDNIDVYAPLPLPCNVDVSWVWYVVSSAIDVIGADAMRCTRDAVFHECFSFDGVPHTVTVERDDHTVERYDHVTMVKPTIGSEPIRYIVPWENETCTVELHGGDCAKHHVRYSRHIGWHTSRVQRLSERQYELIRARYGTIFAPEIMLYAEHHTWDIPDTDMGDIVLEHRVLEWFGLVYGRAQ